MVRLKVRDTEEFQKPGAWHWKRLTMGEAILFGAFFVGSLWMLPDALSPPYRGSYLIFEYTHGSLLWFLLIGGALMFIVVPPSFIMYHSIRYQANVNYKEPKDNSQTSSSAENKEEQPDPEDGTSRSPTKTPEHCPDCGEELDREDNFCSECGNALVHDEERTSG